jgi:signal peptide peptidase SppA
MRLIDIITSPWAMEPAAHAEMIEIYLTHLRGEKIDIAGLEARLGGPLAGTTQGYEIVNGVAVVPVDGILAKRMNLLMKVSGGTSYELLGRDFAQAYADSAAHAVILAIDSPGGSIMGLQEVADVIYVARGRGGKPIVALTDGLMTSAAYWLGSGADALYISSDTTLVGSIGVVYRHIDRSGADAKAGLKVTELYAGKYKTMASEAAPLSDAARADIQSKLNALYSLFVDTVARNRGADSATVLATMAEGRIFQGKEAIAAGLVDGVSTLDALIAQLNSGLRPGRTFRVLAGAAAAKADAEAGAPPATSVSVSNSPERTDMTINREFILANHPDIAEVFRSEGFTRGRDDGFAAGARAERERIQSVEAQALPGHEKLIATLKLDGKTTGAEAAVQILAAEKAKNRGTLAALAADAPLPAPHAPAPSVIAAAPEDSNQPIEQRCKAKWDKNAELRAEFMGGFESYLAYAKADEAGKVRILGKKAA